MNIRPICNFINGPCHHLAPFPSPVVLVWELESWADDSELKLFQNTTWSDEGYLKKIAHLLARYLCIKLPQMLPECERARERNILVILHQVHRYYTFTSGDLHIVSHNLNILKVSWAPPQRRKESVTKNVTFLGCVENIKINFKKNYIWWRNLF